MVGRSDVGIVVTDRECPKTVFQNLTWEQAAELAQKENKIILVDAMREPATPEARKQKDKEEAVWQKVAANLEFCKQHVVAIRIDMASGGWEKSLLRNW